MSDLETIVRALAEELTALPPTRLEIFNRYPGTDFVPQWSLRLNRNDGTIVWIIPSFDGVHMHSHAGFWTNVPYEDPDFVGIIQRTIYEWC